MALGAEKYYNYLAQLGFGQRIGLPLAGESGGILRPPGDWERIDLAASGFGQGFSVTLPQLAKGFMCLANGGVLKPLRLVLDPYVPVQAETRVFEPAVAREVLRMMRSVVDEGNRIEGPDSRPGRRRKKRAPRKRLHPKGDTAQKSLRLLWGSFPRKNRNTLF